MFRSFASRGWSARSVRALVAMAMLSVAAVGHAQETPACLPNPTPPDADKMRELSKSAKDHGFLWKIEKNGKSGYLFGTIHLNKLDWFLPGPKTMAAMREAESFALELDPLDPGVQAKLADPAIMPTGKVDLPAKLKERVAAVARRACVPVSAIEAMHPALQLITLSLADARYAGLEVLYSTEFLISSFAQGTGKTVASLESPELQMKALTAGESKDFIEMVESGLPLFESGRQRKLMQRMLESWGAGNLAEIQQYEKWCECATTPAEKAFYRRLNDDRNPALATGIDQRVQKGRVFVAVGALHMVGPKGLPKLLADMGYKVERVVFDGDVKAKNESKAAQTPGRSG